MTLNVLGHCIDMKRREGGDACLHSHNRFTDKLACSVNAATCTQSPTPNIPSTHTYRNIYSSKTLRPESLRSVTKMNVQGISKRSLKSAVVPNGNSNIAKSTLKPFGQTAWPGHSLVPLE